MFQPHSDRQSLRGSHPNWLSAYRAAKMDEAVAQQRAEFASRKSDWEYERKLGREMHVRELDWTESFSHMDPELYRATFGGNEYVAIDSILDMPISVIDFMR
jgi:hypothetical protein